jgi:hypothetical protein
MLSAYFLEGNIGLILRYRVNIDMLAEECVPDIFQREMPDFDKIPLPEYKPFR